MTRAHIAISVLAFVLLAAPARAQEEPPADDAIATVGDRVVTKADFDHWLAAVSQSSAATGRAVDPPEYARCMAADRRRARRKGRRPTATQLRARCERRHMSLRRQVVTFLLQAAWVREEAESEGISVSPERVRRVFADQRRQAFPTYRDYRRFLRESGASEEDILVRVELDILQARLARRATESARTPTRREVTRYVARHPKRFAGLRPRAARRAAFRRLSQRREVQSLQRFIADFRRRSQAKTACADEYFVDECGNALPV